MNKHNLAIHKNALYVFFLMRLMCTSHEYCLSFRREYTMLMCKHRRKSQAMLKPFSDISFTRHSETPRKQKNCITPCAIMHHNQKTNKTLMKDVQQQNSLVKTAIRMTEMFLKPCFSVFVYLFVSFVLL